MQEARRDANVYIDELIIQTDVSGASKYTQLPVTFPKYKGPANNKLVKVAA